LSYKSIVWLVDWFSFFFTVSPLDDKNAIFD